MKHTCLVAALLFLAACDDSPRGEEPLEPAPSAPRAVTNGDQTVSEGTTVTLDGASSTDADGNISSFSWTQIEGTAVGLTGASTPVATFTAGDVGDTTILRFRLTVEDSTDLSGTAVVTITVIDLNPAPVVDAGANQTVGALTEITLNGMASDDSGIAATTWAQVSGPEAGTISDSDQLIASVTAPDVDQERTITFELAATDDEGKTGRDSVTVTVSPVATAIAFTQQPESPLRNATWSGVTVDVLNASGVRVVGGDSAVVEVTLSVALEDTTDVTADMMGSLSSTAALGRASFSDLSFPYVTAADNGIVLTASAAGLPPSESPVIRVVWPSELPGALFSDSTLNPTRVGLLAGDLLIAGSFSGAADFDFAAGGAVETVRTATGASRDGFLARYTTDGTPVWVKTITSAGNVDAVDLVATADAIYLAVGVTGGDPITFPHETAPVTVAGAGGTDVACARLTVDGNTEWAGGIAGAGNEVAHAVAADSAGALIVVGAFTGSDTDFDPDLVDTALDSSTGTESDGFVVKLDATGDYVWHVHLDGPADAEDAATAAGHQTSSADVLVGGVFGADSFFIRLDASTGGEKVNAAFGGSTASDSVRLLALEEGASNTMYVAGLFSGTVDFDPDVDTAVELTASHDSDVFVARLNMAGDFSWVQRVTADQGTDVVSLAVRSSDLVLAGTALGLADFDPDGDGSPVDFGSARGTWLQSRSLATGALGWLRTWQNPVDLAGTAMAASGSRIAVVGPVAAGFTVDLDPANTRVEVTVPADREAAFAVKLDQAGVVVP